VHKGQGGEPLSSADRRFLCRDFTVIYGLAGENPGGLLVAGGSYTLYCPMYASTNFRVIDNRFTRTFYAKSGQYGPWVYCENAAEVRGNVWDEDNKPLTL
jgi:hypothetical protein